MRLTVELFGGVVVCSTDSGLTLHGLGGIPFPMCFHVCLVCAWLVFGAMSAVELLPLGVALRLLEVLFCCVVLLVPFLLATNTHI